MKAKDMPRGRTMAIAAVFLVGFFFVGGSRIVRAAHYAYEDALFRADPSAAESFSIALRHFDARRPELYDLERAQKYLDITQQLDPAYPRLYLHMARVQFIRADFEQALSSINNEIRSAATTTASAYYVRGLILGFMGSYRHAATNYEQYLKMDPGNWPAYNDYAWVLIKDGRTDDALRTIETALVLFPGNPWLLNSQATALYESGKYPDALEAATQAAQSSKLLGDADWLAVYPGNDPSIAREGILALQEAIRKNTELIRRAVESRPE